MDKGSVNKLSAAKKYDVANSKKLGRYMVASKDLAAGELIFREYALAVGPAAYERGVFCFACMRPLPADTRHTCRKCNLAPLCSPGCEKAGGLHSGRECELIRAKRGLCSLEELTGILLHLRLWLLREAEPESWAQVESLEAHLDKRRNTPVWREREATVVDVFRKLGLDEGSDESVQRLCGAVDVNTFELRAPGLPSGLSGGPLRGLFLRAALMAHACRATARLAVDDTFQMSVHAAVDLPAGEIVSFNYTSPLLGTIDRQEHLQEGKYFRCECRACKDPFEAGSYLSCILCPRCKKDYVAAQNPSERNPYGRKAKWQCQRCKRIFAGCLVKSTLDISRTLVEEIDGDNFKAMESLLERLSRTFHTNHFVMIALKQKILDVCRKEIGSINPQRKILQKMLQLCRELLKVLEVVEPGLSRLKGITLYELHLPIAILANRAYGAREIGAAELLAGLEEARALLRRGLGVLLLEPCRTPEGQLARRALREARLLEQSIEDARALAGQEREERRPRRITGQHGSRAK